MLAVRNVNDASTPLLEPCPDISVIAGDQVEAILPWQDLRPGQIAIPETIEPIQSADPDISFAVLQHTLGRVAAQPALTSERIDLGRVCSQV